MKRLILMRGIPGSGKSTMARQMARDYMKNGKSVAICSTDDFHMEDGKYVFKPDMLGDFHVRNQILVRELMAIGVGLVIVDNTNIKRKDMKVYISNAGAYRYEVKEVVVGKEYLVPDMDASPHSLEGYIQMCAERNTHKVPKDVIDRMARTFQV